MRKPAVLRGFRALYLGLVFNVLVMGPFRLPPSNWAAFCWLARLADPACHRRHHLVVQYTKDCGRSFSPTSCSHLGHGWLGLGLLVHPELLDAVGGLDALLAHAIVASKTSMFPAMDDPAQWVPILLAARGAVVGELLPRCRTRRRRIHRATHVQCQGREPWWWGHAVVQCGALRPRPWPWILIALASIVVFPRRRICRRRSPTFLRTKLATTWPTQPCCLIA